MDFDYLQRYLENSLFSPSGLPVKEGLPFLLNDPELSFARLSLECSAYLEQEKQRLASLKKRASGISKKKTEKHIEARTKQLNRLKKLIGSFSVETQAGISPLNPYEELLFRDWCWKTEEIEKYIKFLSPQASKKSHLFLGAGACGLSYNFSKLAEESEVLATDINPFLLLASHKLLSGKSLKLTDTPHFPNSLKSVSESFNVPPALKAENHHQVFADFRELPFKEGAFEHINATWFLDVISPSLSQSLENIVYYLGENGSFTYIGPSNFHKDNLSDSLVMEEILEQIKTFFEDLQYEVQRVDYLDSGYNSQIRSEQVLMVNASRPKKGLAKKMILQDETHFKLDDKLRFKMAEAQTLSQIFKHIKSDMPFDELAKKIQSEFGFDYPQSLAYAKAVIGKIQS